MIPQLGQAIYMLKFSKTSFNRRKNLMLEATGIRERRENRCCFGNASFFSLQLSNIFPRCYQNSRKFYEKKSIITERTEL